MVNQIVSGMWGPRQESPRDIAERVSAFAERLARISPLFTDWREMLESDEPGPPAALDPAGLAAHVVASGSHDDADHFGYRVTLLIHRDGEPAVDLCISAGGRSEHLLNSVSVTLDADQVTGADGVEDTVALEALLLEVLVALAEVWDVDHGEIYDHDLADRLEDEFDLENSDPRCGRAVHLSGHRAEGRVPEGLPVTWIDTLPDGVILDLRGPGGEPPDTATVISVHAALRDTGALAPLPEPMKGPKLCRANLMTSSSIWPRSTS